MQIRKRNKNNQKRLYEVSLYCRVYTRDEKDLRVYQFTIYKICLAYAYNENEAIKKVKQYTNTVLYPHIYGYEIDFSNIKVNDFDVIDIYTQKTD